MTTTDGARRLGTMLRHSTHLFFGLLWAVGLARWVRRDGGWPELVLALLVVAVYLAGLAWQARRGATRTAGTLWLGALVGCWAVLCLLSGGWLWLGFPLFFLVLFLLPPPASWLVVVAMTSWAVTSPLLRGAAPSAGGVLGPAFGAGVAVVGWLVFRQLRADVAEQARLTAEQARLAEQVSRAQRQLLVQAEERARDQERERLARDLHDTLAQGLNSIVVLSRSVAARHPELAGELAVVEQTARDNLAQARGMVRDMAGPGGSGGSLADELRQVVAGVQRREDVIGSGLEVSLEVAGEEQALGTARREALLNAARSLLANVVQHAGAGHCRVTLSWFDDEVVLDVVDDGNGLDPRHRDGFGLRALRSRADELGGALALESAPGEGTGVVFRVPLQRPLGGGR